MEESINTYRHTVPLKEYLSILLKRRWMVLTVFVCVFTYGALHALTATPIYKATVQLLIERQPPRILEKQETESYGYGEEFYQTHYKLLAGPALAKKVVEKLNLKANPYYSSVFLNLPSNADEAAKQRAEEALIGSVASGIEVSPIRQSSLVNVSYSHSDPKFAATMVNTIAQCYIEQSLELRFSASQEAAAWLKEKMNESRKKLEESEAKLNQYKRENNIVALDDKENITAQRLEKLNQDLLSAQTRRMEVETRFKEVSQGKPISEVLNNPLITLMKGNEAKLMAEQSELSRKFGSDHPRMLQLNNELAATRSNIAAEMSQVIQAIKNEYNMAKVQEENLKKALEAQKSDTQDMSDKTIQYRVLLRDVETYRALYENMLKSLKTTMATENLPVINIRIVYPATVPSTPVGPNKPRDLAIAAALGLFLAVALPIGLESLNTTIRSPEEVENVLQIRNLALIPHIQFSSVNLDNKGLPELSANTADDRIASESYRGLRTAIQYSSPDKTPRVILVTSPLPGDGKSMTSVNLARVMAKSEPNILLVDADMRRPSLHNLFHLPEEPGLSNFLAGEVDELPIMETPVSNLFLVSSGKIPRHPSELLGSERMREFLDLAKGRFGRVIVDSPPLISVTDPAILSTLADGVILVLKAEGVQRRVAIDARDLLLEVNALILGVVLNNVPIKEVGYYYSRYYRYHSYYSREEASLRRHSSASFPGPLGWITNRLNGLRKRA